MENVEANTPAKRLKVKLAGSFSLLAMWALLGVYNWLVNHDVIDGPLFFSGTAVLALGVSLFILAKTPLLGLKRRWEKLCLLIPALIMAALVVLGAVNLTFPFFGEMLGMNFICLYAGIAEVALAYAVAKNYETLWPRKDDVVQEEQHTGKRRINHPWLFAAGCALFVLHTAYFAYDWLLIKKAIEGPEFQTDFALFGLLMPMIYLSYVNIKHRWVRNTLLIFGALLTGVCTLGVVDMFRPFPVLMHDALLGLSMFPSMIFLFAGMFVATIYAPPYKKKKSSRKEKIKAAIVVVLALAGLAAFWFGTTRLLHWLLTR
ncbi:MAG: hypothetical protein FWE98_08455 [Oscillospiraceae bacterium]|nr:hypothetical protein [Oscillospiraceae bacterium]